MLQAIYRQLGEAVALLVGREAMVQATARDSGPLSSPHSPRSSHKGGFVTCVGVGANERRDLLWL
jgi:hypothetical protein